MREKKVTSAEKKLFAKQAQKERTYWLKKLSGDMTRSHFSVNRARGAAREILECKFDIPTELAARLLAMSNGSDARLHLILVAAVAALLYKHTGNKTIIVGSPIDFVEVEGELINKVLALKHDCDGQMSFKSLLLQTRDTVNEAVENQNYPVESLLNDLDLPAEGENFALFDVAIVLEGLQDKRYLDDFEINTIFSFRANGEHIEASIDYNAAVISEPEIRAVSERFLCLLSQALLDVDLPLATINVVAKKETDFLLRDCNATERSYPREASLNALFKAHVARHRDRIAVVCDDQAISFGHLDNLSEQLASELLTRGAKPGEVVGLMLERSIEMVVGILAVLKAGGAYLPLDFRLPLNRNLFMLDDSETRFLISQKSLVEISEDKLNFQSLPELIHIDGFQEERAVADVHSSSTADSLAYLIYTSGTTGTPKAVMIEHRNVVNFMHELKSTVYDRYGSGLRLGLTSSFIFDASVQLTFGSLLFGHTLFITNELERADGVRLISFCNKYGIDVIDGTPTHLHLLAQGLGKGDAMLSVRHLLIGGDVISINHAKAVFAGLAREDAIITNVYGPTECTVNASSFDVTRENLHHLENIPIGKPIANYRVYVLDRDGNLAPLGLNGELYIAGDGVSRGYWKRESLTDSKFVPDPFLEGQRMYRTGDLVRWGEDGNLRFIGRIDNQIKLRGYRIELGEVETRLLKHNDIRQAVVTMREDDAGDKYLCAYFAAGRKFLTSELRTFMLEELPDYLIPSYFVPMESMPLMPSGKIDRKNLPEPFELIESEVDYVAPRNDVESRLASVWQAELRLDKIGVLENYFNIGGDSIKSISLVNAINETFDGSFKIVDLYQNETIEKFARVIDQEKQSGKQEYQDALAEVESVKEAYLSKP